MRNALLALLFTLLLPATAGAAVDQPGVSEIRQDGAVVTWVLGIPADELTSLAGETKESIAGYMSNNVRMSVDAESCPGAMTGATPERRDGVPPYARVRMEFKCPLETGKFAVVNEMLIVSAVDYELGGASGTFRFDADHALMEVSSPEFSRWVKGGFEALALGWEHVLFVAILLLGARTVREFGAFVACVTAAYLIALVLAVSGVISVPERVIEALTVASVVAVAALPVLGIAGRLQLSIVFGLALVHGLAFALVVPNTDALGGFVLGLLLAEALIVTLAGALPHAWRARGRTPGARARDRAHSAAH
jgi:hypothetical protein